MTTDSYGRLRGDMDMIQHEAVQHGGGAPASGGYYRIRERARAALIETEEEHAALSRALDLLERHQWEYERIGTINANQILRCMECGRGSLSGEHNPDCALAQLLAENGREVRYAE
jgi:hypothetical protein